MSAGPFEWKQALLGPKVRVEITDTSISVSAKKRQQLIKFEEISEIYFYRIYVSGFTHFLSMEIGTANGGKARFAASGYGSADGFNAQQCRKAAIEFLTHYERVAPDAQIYEGAKTSTMIKALYVGLSVLMFAIIAAQILAAPSPYGPVMVYSTLAIIAVVLFFAIWREYKKIYAPALITAQSAREGLERYEQSL